MLLNSYYFERPHFKEYLKFSRDRLLSDFIYHQLRKTHKIYYHFIINSRTNFYIEYTAAKLDCQGFKKISPTLSVVFFGKMEYGMTKTNVQTYLRVSYLTGVEYILYSKRKFSLFKTGYFRKKYRALPSYGHTR